MAPLKFLLTNDDGVQAPGLAALEQVAARLGSVTVLAPVDHHSGCSHRATTDRPLELSDQAPNWYALNGTPVDCARVGLLHVAAGADWVLSGINDGGNLGADVYHSGTVAAVREAVLLGHRGIAISQYRDSRLGPIHWELSAQWTVRVIADLIPRDCPLGSYWNVNLPALRPEDADPEIVYCNLDPHPLPIRYESEGNTFHYRSRYQDRQRASGFDVEQCFAGNITVTQLRLEAPRDSTLTTESELTDRRHLPG